MAQVTHPSFPNLVIDLDSATQTPTGNFDYNVQNIETGKVMPFSSSTPYSPEEVEAGIGDSKNPVYANMAANLRDFGSSSTDDDGVFFETIGPTIQSVPGTILGTPADMVNNVLQIADAGINTMAWAFDGFEGDMSEQRRLSSDPKDVFLGSKYNNRFLENLGDVARSAEAIREEKMGTYGDTDIPYDLGLTAVLGPNLLSFDTSPDKSTKTREYISLITEVIAAAPVEGSLIAKLATKLASTTTNATTQNVYDALSEMSNKSPLKAAAAEAALGASAGAGMVGSLEALEAAYGPNPPEWMKSIVMAGGGIILPMATATAGSVVKDVVQATPVINWAGKVLGGLSESLTPTGADKAAVRSISTKGGDWKNRFQVLGVLDQMKLAIAEGRTMDEATRIAYTTPQLMRNEANLLEKKLDLAAKDMTPEEIETQRGLIEGLRQYGNFQEGQLKTISTSQGIGAQAYAKYSERVMDRRDLVFDALNDDILKLQSEGTPSFDESAAGTGPTVEQVNAMSGAYENTLSKMEQAAQESIQDALEKVEAYRKQAPENMSDTDRLNFNLLIRKEIEASYTEIDILEDLLWNNISGLDLPKTKSYVNPEGADMGPEILIDGVPVGEHFAAKVSNLKAGERENQSKFLWKLTGRDALVDQASKGAGPDAEKLARQNLVVKNSEDILKQREIELNTASERLSSLNKDYQSPELTRAKASVASLEAQIDNIPTGQTLEDPTVIRRINSAQQKLAGARATVEELSKVPVTDPMRSKAEAAFDKAQKSFTEAQTRLDLAKGNLEIFMGTGVDFEGSPVDLVGEVNNTSILGVREIDGVTVGREAQEVQNVVSLLKAEMSYEQGKLNRKPAKVAAIGSLIDDLQKAISDPENFSVDTVALDAARKMTATKKTLFEKGSVSKIRSFNPRGESRVDIEQTMDMVAKPSTQETSLRQLEAALTRVATGEGTPFRVITREDGTVGPELDLDFDLQGFSEGPPAPFQSINVEGGRSLGLKVSEGTQPTQQNIEIIQKTLWDRFGKYGEGETFNESAASKWIDNNSAAINWLRNATGKETGFENLASAERVVRAIKGATRENLNKTIKTLRENNAFNEEFTEIGFRQLVKESQTRSSNINAAALFLDNPVPYTIGQNFLKKFDENPRVLDETLKVLENGVLPDGSNPALDGFKQAVGESLIQQAVTGPGGGTRAANEASVLSDSMQRTVKIWDPEKLIALSQDPKTKKLLSDLYGPESAKLFDEIAEGARLQSAVGQSATPDVSRQDQVSDEIAGNVGRMIGGFLAQYTPVSSLVLTGVGRRYGVNTISKVRGSAIDVLIVDYLMNPKLAVAAMERFPINNLPVEGTMLDRVMNRAKLYAHKKFIGNNARRIERLGTVPGVLFELGVGGDRLDEEDDEDIGQQSSLQPVAPPVRKMAANMPPSRSPVSGSSLSQVNPVAPRPTGQTSQETLSGLSQLGMPLFANQGGYIDRGSMNTSVPMEESGIFSITKKPKQIVG